MITYNIEKRIGSLHDGRYQTQVNMVSWNNAPAVIDIRKWDTETGTPLKGLTIQPQDAQALAALLALVND